LIGCHHTAGSLGEEHSVFTVYQKKSKVKIKSPTPEFFFEECSGFGGQGAEGASHAIPLCGFRLRVALSRQATSAALHQGSSSSQLPSRPILLAPLFVPPSLFCGAALLELGNLFIPACARPAGRSK
jgi:hypothetical protein